PQSPKPARGWGVHQPRKGVSVPHVYKAWNGPMPTTAAQAGVTTGTDIKTMLQLSSPATRQITVISWGYSIDAIQSGAIELLQTDVAATVTAHVAAGVQPQEPNQPASLLTLGTSNTGYTGTAEGSITTTRVFDVQQIASATPTNLSYSYQFMPATRPVTAV